MEQVNSLSLSDNALRQQIDATAAWRHYRSVRDTACAYSCGQYWKREGAYVYLIQTRAGNVQERLGRRSPDTEALHARFLKERAAVQSRLQSISRSLQEHERLNKALRVGYAPRLLVELLAAVDDAALGSQLLVIDDCALFVFEQTAGVRLSIPSVMNSPQTGVSFLACKGLSAQAFGALLVKVDKSFKLVSAKNDRHHWANKQKFTMTLHGTPPLEDRWAYQEPVFQGPVVSRTGRIALMRTLRPSAFIALKRALVSVQPHAAAQADFVEGLLENYAISEPFVGPVLPSYMRVLGS